MWDTAPYLHDGSAETLREVLIDANVDGAHGDLDELTPQEIDDLIQFLRELE